MLRAFILSAVVVAALWWFGCVALYAATLAGQGSSEPLVVALFVGSAVVGVLAAQALRLSGGAKLPPSSPLAIAVCVSGFLCMGVQTAVNWRTVIGDLSGGALSGEPGDRYLNSHGTRARDLTEEEYRHAQAAKWRQMTAFSVCFSSITLGMALHSLAVWRARQAGTEPPLPLAELLPGHAPE